jgi:hypothetical protein
LRKIVFALMLFSLCTFAFTAHDYGAETRFSSNFTDLTQDCKDAFKEVGEGQDMPLKCRGYGGYYIYISYSAFASHIIINTINGDDGIDLATESLNYSDKNKIGESLIIKGLKGYEYIDFEVNFKTTTDAITKVRKLADRAYLKGSN